LDLVEKLFDTICFPNVFCSVFELPSLRNTLKRNKTKKVEEKLTSKFLSIFLEKVFDMDFLQKYLFGVFELPLPRNAQKCTIKKVKEKKSDGGWVVGRVGHSANVRGGPSIYFAGPSSNQVRFLGGALRFSEASPKKEKGHGCGGGGVREAQGTRA
jgi:hypothetical protein